MRLTKQNILRISLVFGVFFFCINAQAQNTHSVLDSTDYTYLDSTISKKIFSVLNNSNVQSQKETILFSVRFNINDNGEIINLEGSERAPKQIIDSLRTLLNKTVKGDNDLVKIVKKGNLKKNLILVPIYLVPKVDLSDNHPLDRFNSDMIGQMFLFNRMKYRKSKDRIYYYYYTPSSYIVLSPVSYPTNIYAH